MLYINKSQMSTPVSCPDVLSYRWIGTGTQIMNPDILEQGLSKDLRQGWEVYFKSI